jgi:hypothetical protein
MLSYETQLDLKRNDVVKAAKLIRTTLVRYRTAIKAQLV